LRTTKKPGLPLQGIPGSRGGLAAGESKGLKPSSPGVFCFDGELLSDRAFPAQRKTPNKTVVQGIVSFLQFGQVFLFSHHVAPGTSIFGNGQLSRLVRTNNHFSPISCQPSLCGYLILGHELLLSTLVLSVECELGLFFPVIQELHLISTI
jgi:hypothetical protein